MTILPKQNLPVFVFGHRNPDTDSAVSAVVAAQLKGELDSSQVYQPFVLGEPNRQTKWLFTDAEVPLPPLRDDLRYQVSELMNPYEHVVAPHEHLGKAMDFMQQSQLSMVPVVDEERHLLGILSDRLPQNQYFYSFNVEDFLGVLLELDDLVQALPLEWIGGQPQKDEGKGRLVLLSHDHEEIPAHVGPGDVIIVGPHRRSILRLCGLGVRAIIVAEASDSFCASLASHRDSVPLFRYRGSLLALTSHLPRAIPVKHVMATDFPSLRPDQRVSEVIDLIAESPHALPVIDPAGKLVGVFSRREALNQKPRKVILVDHFERAQSMRGFDLAEVIEIIDHHRIGDVQTINPARIDCRPIGSTASILALQFRESGKTPSAAQARLLLGALVSDTLLLGSPTTTSIDREVAEWLSGLAQVSLMAWGRDVLTQNDELAEGVTEKLVLKDCKEFSHGDYRFLAAQIETVNLDLLTPQRQELLQRTCDQVRANSGAAFLILMITDVFRGESRLLVSDSDCRRARHLLEVNVPEEGKIAHGWVSRKKQLLPYIIGRLGTWRP